MKNKLDDAFNITPTEVEVDESDYQNIIMMRKDIKNQRRAR